MSSDDEELLEHLQSQPSQICQRCSDYDVLRAFEFANPLDNVLYNEMDDHETHSKNEAQYDMALGKLSSLVLTPSCQLCRLIYRIIPRETFDPDEDMLRLTPFKSYIREAGWEGIPANDRPNYAVFMGLRKPEVTVTAANPGQNAFQLSEMQLEAIALDSKDTFPGRKWSNARWVGPTVDLSLAEQGMKFCLENHPRLCQVWHAKELSMISLIDVHERKVVPYPGKCEYVALSYVWGGVIPVPRALEARKLPQTLEDAITVTKDLGLRYIWVCV